MTRRTAENSSEDLNDRARKAVANFRSMVPTLTSFARVLTGNPKIRVAPARSGAPRTDGKTIWYVPPLQLAERLTHDRAVCDKRDPSTGEQRCKACAVRETVMVNIYHEISHVAFGSFQMVSEDEKRRIMARVLAAHPEILPAGVTVDRLRKLMSMDISMVEVSRRFNPFFGELFNILEDGRIDNAMFKARRGTKAMYMPDFRKMFTDDVRDSKGELVKWNLLPMNTQAINLLLIKNTDIPGCEELFHPVVVRRMDDPKLNDLLATIRSATSSAQVFELTFAVLHRMRQLGFFLQKDEPKPEDDAQPEPEPEPEKDEPESEPDQEEEENSDDQSEDKADVPAPDNSESSDPVDDPEPDDVASDRDGAEDQDVSSDESDPSADPASSDDAVPDDDGSPGEPEGTPGEGVQDDAEEAAPGDDADLPSDQEGGPEDDSAEPEGNGEPEAGDADGGDPTEGSADEGDQSEPEGGTSDQPGEDASDLSEDSDSDAGPESEQPGPGGEDRSPLDDADDQDADQAGGELDTDSSADPSYDGSAEGDGEPSEGEGKADDSVREEPPMEGGDAEGGMDRRDDGSSNREDDPAVEPDREELHGGDEVGADPGVGDGDGVLPDQAADAGREREEGPESEDVDPGVEEDSEDDEEVDDEYDPEDWEGDLRDLEAEQGIEYGQAHETVDTHKEIHEAQEAKIQEGEPTDEQAIQQAIEVAVIQGQYFETASLHVTDLIFHDRVGDGTGFRKAAIEAAKQGMHVPESILGPATLATKRVFEENQRARKSKNLKSGKVRANALGKRAWSGDERLFGKKEVPGKRKYAVVLGLDMSGSTGFEKGRPLKRIKQAVAAQAELCERAGVDFAIYGHTTSPGYVGDEEMELHIYKIKEFDQPWRGQEVQDRLASVSPCAGNLDGHSLEFYRKAVESTSATDKIVVYYTDGRMPASNFDEELEVLQREIKYCKQRGITLIGVGIGTDSPLEHGLDTVQVDDASDLPKVVKHLGKRLTERR